MTKSSPCAQHWTLGLGEQEKSMSLRRLGSKNLTDILLTESKVGFSKYKWKRGKEEKKKRRKKTWKNSMRSFIIILPGHQRSVTSKNMVFSYFRTHSWGHRPFAFRFSSSPLGLFLSALEICLKSYPRFYHLPPIDKGSNWISLSSGHHPKG